MYLTEIDPDETKTQIKNLNSKHASDLFDISASDIFDIFDISANFLKFAAKKVIHPLTFLFNESIRNGSVPEKLKVAVVYPVHKKIQK